MKILVLQLARLGDIYQSWPALRALRRTYPGAQIDVMVRPRFAEALDGLSAVSNRILLPTQDFLAPLIGKDPDLSESKNRLDVFLSDLRAKNYDWIINYSFSPLSSYLVHSLQTSMTQVAGYTRHNDGYFNMLGEISAYFYAQVGITRPNRFHLTELMAGMAGVDLAEDDWRDPQVRNEGLALPEKYVVIHVGASETQKSMPAFKWARVAKFFAETNPDHQIVLVGAQSERTIADAIVLAAKTAIVDLVGKTKLTDLFPILRYSRLLVGCDSAPIHIASLTKTPCLNISMGQVNFWETGPRSPRSYVFRAQNSEEIVSEYVAAMMTDILRGHEPKGLIKYVSGSPCYVLEEASQDRFAWDLIKAVYMGDRYPVTEDLRFFEGCEKLNAMNDVIIEQLQTVQKSGIEKIKPILDRGDEVIHAIGNKVPELQVLTRWLRAERSRVEPGSLAQIAEATLKMHQSLKSLLRPYILEEQGAHQGGASGEV